MAELCIDNKTPDHGSIDLHGIHPRDEHLYPTIEDALCQAYDAGLSRLTIIHGHGFNRRGYVRAFVNSNTGYLGQIVREMLRYNPDLRQWMLAKFDCSHDGSTTVRIRRGRRGIK